MYIDIYIKVYVYVFEQKYRKRSRYPSAHGAVNRNSPFEVNEAT